MRSFDRSMPEELNRVLTDHASALLLCSTEVAMTNLRHEAVAGRAELVGDVMVDVAMAIQPQARERTDLVAARGVEPRRAICWRPHTGPATSMTPSAWLDSWRCSRGCRCPWCCRSIPRTDARLRSAGLRDRLAEAAGVTLTEPLGYFELTALLCNARAAITDSGGLQKEAYLAGVPCVTLRANTEWTETVELGWNVLADLDLERVLAALEREVPTASAAGIWRRPRR